MRPNDFQKMLDIQNLEEGLSEYFRLMSENARLHPHLHTDWDISTSPRSVALEMV